MSKISLILVVMFGISISTLAQKITTLNNSVELINVQRPEQFENYILAIYKSNLEPYRLLERDVTIHFEDGFDCVLISAKQLQSKLGWNVELMNYSSEFPINFKVPVFKILEDGSIQAIYTSTLIK